MPPPPSLLLLTVGFGVFPDAHSPPSNKRVLLHLIIVKPRNECEYGCPPNTHCEWGVCECNEGFTKSWGVCRDAKVRTISFLSLFSANFKHPSDWFEKWRARGRKSRRRRKVFNQGRLHNNGHQHGLHVSGHDWHHLHPLISFWKDRGPHYCQISTSDLTIWERQHPSK